MIWRSLTWISGLVIGVSIIFQSAGPTFGQMVPEAGLTISPSNRAYLTYQDRYKMKDIVVLPGTDDPLSLGSNFESEIPGSVQIEDLVNTLRIWRLDGLEGGETPNPQNVPQLNDILQMGLNKPFVKDGAPSIADRLPQWSDCSHLDSDSLDPCYLPVVGLVSNTPGDTTFSTPCSATIIGPRHVVTATHCLCGTPTAIVLGTSHFGSRSFYEGTDPIHTTKADLQTPKSSTLILLKEPGKLRGGYCKTHASKDDDIEVIEVASSVTFADNLQAVIIAAPADNANIELSGFGPDPSATGQTQGLKRYLSTTVAKSGNGKIEMVSPIGDSCFGDSGSGAFLRLYNGRLGIFAVLSAGTDICGPDKPSSYLDLSTPERLTYLQERIPDLQIALNQPPADDVDTVCLGYRCKAGRIAMPQD